MASAVLHVARSLLATPQGRGNTGLVRFHRCISVLVAGSGGKMEKLSISMPFAMIASHQGWMSVAKHLSLHESSAVASLE